MAKKTVQMKKTVNLKSKSSSDSKDEFSAFKFELGKELDLPSGKVRLSGVISVDKTGEADIYLVEDSAGNKLVLKKYKRSSTVKTEVLDKIKAINHPHVIKMIDYGNHGGSFYELMEYAGGHKITDRGPITDAGELKEIIKQCSSALELFHKKQIVHRDIKPDNIFLKDKKGIHALIADFGISSLLKENTSRKKTTLALSFGYAAPELLLLDGGNRNQTIVGPESDYFALGLTLISLWKGEDWFSGLSTNQIIQMICRSYVEPPEGMPGEIAHAVRGLLVHKDTDRWGPEQIRAWLDGKKVAVTASVPQPEERVKPFEFTREKGKAVTAANPEELADLILKYRDQGVKYLYRNYFVNWIKPQSEALALELEDIILSNPLQKEKPYLGLLQAYYLLCGANCYINRKWTKHSFAPGTDTEDILDSIGTMLEDSGKAEEYLDSEYLEAFYLAKGLETAYDRIREDILNPLKKGVISRKKAGNKLILQLQKGDTLRIKGKDYRSFSDLAAAPGGLKRFLADELHQTDSKFLCWLEEMFLKTDSGEIAESDISELLELVKQMPWLKKYDTKLAQRLNKNDSDGYTDLMKMVQTGDIKACKTLLEHGADINFKNDNGITAFALAAMLGKKDLMEFLRDQGAELNPEDSGGSPLIHLLAGKDRIQSLEFLINNGISVDTVRKNDGYTPLMEAVDLGADKAVKLLLDYGADPGIKSRNGSAPLMEAVEDSKPDLVRLLLENRADPNIKTDISPLHRAVHSKQAGTADLLLKKGADPNVQNSSGQTPLMYAVYDKTSDHTIIEMLLKAGADPYRIDTYENNPRISPFSYAAQYKKSEIVKLFLKYKANPRRSAAKDPDGRSPLFYAYRGAQRENILLLSSRRSWIKAKDKNRETSYEAAVRCGYHSREVTRKSLRKNKRTTREAERIRKRMRSNRRSYRSVTGPALLLRIPAALFIFYTCYWMAQKIYYFSDLFPNIIGDNHFTGTQIFFILFGYNLILALIQVWLVSLLTIRGMDKGAEHPIRTCFSSLIWVVVYFIPGILVANYTVDHARIQDGNVVLGEFPFYIRLLHAKEHLWALLHPESLNKITEKLPDALAPNGDPAAPIILIFSLVLITGLLIVSRILHRDE